MKGKTTHPRTKSSSKPHPLKPPFRNNKKRNTTRIRPCATEEREENEDAIERRGEVPVC